MLQWVYTEAQGLVEVGSSTILDLFGSKQSSKEQREIRKPSSVISAKQKKKNCKTNKQTNMWRLNNMQLLNQWVSEEIKEEIKKIPRDKC